ncbi:MAG TPA: 2-hydroxyacid dehydrogenase [Capillimicrobium sp.]|nr:2-hydroxyacid dehydrogenase [Capillimicrobium sp.]
MHFVCIDGEPQFEEVVTRLADELLVSAGHTFTYHDTTPASEAEYAERLEGADGVLVLFTVPPEVLRAGGDLKVLSWCGTGVARFVDLDAASAGGVTVCNVPSYGANAVAEHALMLLLGVARRLPRADALVRDGAWEQFECLELTGRRLGVVGLGTIGERMVQLGKGVGMDVVAWTRRATPERAASLGVELVSLEELFDTSDAVSIHLAHTSETERIVDRSLLERLHDRAIVVNTARAEVVDTDALAELVAEGRLWGVGADVFDSEPPEPDDGLLGSERSVLTPHTAFFTASAAEEQYRIAIANLAAFAEGRPTNVVD